MKIADSRQVKQVATKMSEEYLHCRTFGHNWVQYRVVRVRGGFETSIYCPSCKNARHLFVSAKTGEVLASNYNYAPGYLIKGLGRVQADSKGMLRLEALGRSTADGDYVIEIDEL